MIEAPPPPPLLAVLCTAVVRRVFLCFCCQFCARGFPTSPLFIPYWLFCARRWSAVYSFVPAVGFVHAAPRESPLFFLLVVLCTAVVRRVFHAAVRTVR